MAERYEIVIDFAKYPVGTRVVLENHSAPNNIDYDTTDVVMAFDVAAEPTHLLNNTVPEVINPDNDVMRLTPELAVATRTMEFERQGGEWTVNGQTWADVVNSGFTEVVASPKLGDVEIWELQNKSGGWFHPVHIHLVDFKILDRNGQPPLPYERGPKDVAYVGENETVRVLMRFGPQVGRYMMHCHNLVHEDHDMMVQFEVGAGGHHPIDYDRPKHQPAPELRGDEPRSGPSPSSGPGSAPVSAPAQQPPVAGSVAPKPKPKRTVKVKGQKKKKKKKRKTRKRKPKRKAGAKRKPSARR
jgi:hypothetical protein